MKLDQDGCCLGTPKFQEVLKDEIEQRAVEELPLSQALRYGNYVADERPAVMVHRVEQRGGFIDRGEDWTVFAGIDAGSCCAE